MKRLLIVVVMLLAIPLLTTIPAFAQPNATWTSEFFDNPYLIGPAKVTLRSTSIAYDWGTGSPGSSIPADNFSGRLATDVTFPAGTYRFYIRADDSVHLYIDFQSYINTWDNPRPNEVLTADVTLTNNNHHIQIDYKENSGNAYIYVSWANLATNPTGPNFPVPTPTTPAPGGSWTGEYFNNIALTGSASAIVSEASPTHSWSSSAPLVNINADNFSVRWTSSQSFDGQPYRITVRADDGVRVYVDNILYVNEWHSATGQTYTSDLQPSAGNHTVRVEFYEAGGLAFIDFNLARVTTQTPTGSWAAEYFNNNSLTESAFVTTSEASPTHDWGTGAPQLNMNADNFSVRWTSSQSFDGQPYRINVRADDGIRVYVDNVLYINEWHDATAQTYTADLQPGAGNHTVRVEFYEAGGVAYIDFTLARIGTAPTPTNTTAQLTINTGALNVRNAPNPITGAILTKVRFGETYPIIGRNSNSSWWQINVNGVVGWVSGSYVNTANTQNVPITTGTTNNPPATAYALTTSANLNMRSLPSASSSRIGIIPRGFTAYIVARNSTNTWWKVTYSDTTGWVSGAYVMLPSQLDLNRVPVANR